MLVLGSVFRLHCLIVYYYFEFFNLFLYFVRVLMQKRKKKNKEKISHICEDFRCDEESCDEFRLKNEF